MSLSRIRCSACKKRIPDHKPDLILRNLDAGGQPRYYHTRCGGAAYAAAMEKPSVYQLTVRHVEEVANCWPARPHVRCSLLRASSGSMSETPEHNRIAEELGVVRGEGHRGEP